MARPLFEFADPDQVVRDYESGMSLLQLTGIHGGTYKPLRRLLDSRGVTMRPRGGRRGPNVSFADPEHPVVRAYCEDMRSLDSIAAEQGVSRKAVRLFLVKRGITIRPPSADAAHDARRGQKNTPEHRHRIAATKALRGVGSDYEAEFVLMLSDLAARDVTTQQQAGPHNIDITVGPIAVEIFGGHWHASGHHARRDPERVRDLFDRGWNVLIVWVTKSHPLHLVAAKHAVAFAEETRRNPALRRHYRMLWGDGEPVTTPSLQLHDVT